MRSVVLFASFRSHEKETAEFRIVLWVARIGEHRCLRCNLSSSESIQRCVMKGSFAVFVCIQRLAPSLRLSPTHPKFTHIYTHTQTHTFSNPKSRKGYPQKEVRDHVGALTQSQTYIPTPVPGRARRMMINETHTRTYEAPKSTYMYNL